MARSEDIVLMLANACGSQSWEHPSTQDKCRGLIRDVLWTLGVKSGWYKTSQTILQYWCHGALGAVYDEAVLLQAETL